MHSFLTDFGATMLNDELTWKGQTQECDYKKFICFSSSLEKQLLKS